MGKKPIYITLDALMFNDAAENQDTKLVKRVDENYLGKTFGEVLDKMVDGTPDEYNPEAYNAQEMQTANYVKNLLQIANTNPGDVQIYALSKDEPPQEINVGINDKLSDYSDKILKKESVPDQDGAQKSFQKIDLTISDNTGGGYRLQITYK